MKIDRILLRQIRMPLVHPFETSFGRTTERSIILVEVLAGGLSGWGEVTCGEGPFFNEEWTDGAWLLLRDWIGPRAVGREFASASEFGRLMPAIRGHQMTKGGLECAVWDLEARMAGQPLYRQIGGGARQEIPCGVSIGLQGSDGELLDRISAELAAGYQRIKIKIKPGRDVEMTALVREKFPRIKLMADANSAYTLGDAGRLKELDDFYLMMIEQPLAWDDIIDHATLQKQLETPICLDECIRSVRHAEQAIRLGACRILNIKLGRVGGFAGAKAVHDIAARAGVPVWCGGMLESGIGRAHNIALSTLENFVLPGDVSASKRYWERDIIHPPVEVSGQGTIHVSEGLGLGYEIDRELIEKLTVRREEIVCSTIGFGQLLKQNRNYRVTWIGQVVSEIGDNFNTLAVFSLALTNTNSGLIISGIMIARALPVLLSGPIAGVLLDRMDRKHLMIASDLIRAVVGFLFIFALRPEDTWALFVLSFLLMFASPFFTSGRASILPTITSKEELHTANSLTRTTQWTAVTLGALLGGVAAMQFGYRIAFVFNALSFLFSAACISRLQAPKGFKVVRRAMTEARVLQPFQEYVEGLKYMRSVPLLMAIALVHMGWATGGGAAQILFTLFGEVVYPYGPAGMGMIWGCAGVGLVIGGTYANRVGANLTFDRYKRLVVIVFSIHGLSYVAFSQTRPFWLVLVFIAMSRFGMGVASILNMTLLLRHVPDEFRGRVFATLETLVWGTMMVSMALTGLATEYLGPRTIGTIAGMLGCSTAVIWLVAEWRGMLVEPEPLGIAKEEVEVHGEPGI